MKKWFCILLIPLFVIMLVGFTKINIPGNQKFEQIEEKASSTPLVKTEPVIQNNQSYSDSVNETPVLATTVPSEDELSELTIKETFYCPFCSGANCPYSESGECLRETGNCPNYESGECPGYNQGNGYGHCGNQRNSCRSRCWN